MIDPVPDPSQPPPTRGIVLHKAVTVYDWLSPPMLFYREGCINRRAADLLELSPGHAVLDVGCATGNATFAAAARLDAARGGLAVGLDASIEMIARARRKIRGRPCRFDVAPAEGMPYRDGVFDRAVSTMFFHHLNLADKLTALREVFRVLAPGGLFVLVDVDVPTNWIGRVSARSGQWLFDQPELGENIEGKLPALFPQAGFVDIRRRAHDLGYITTFSLRKP
ncbi:MAG: methyltransferase domain-containing protein [Planctomycetota bacterium]|nr:methyltransferase domain-containing protein [Planctomycetota bacterium]